MCVPRVPVVNENAFVRGHAPPIDMRTRLRFILWCRSYDIYRLQNLRICEFLSGKDLCNIVKYFERDNVLR